MTRNPAHSANADDSWEQLEADLFGVEVGKEHTAAERIASEPVLPVPEKPIEAIPKPLEEEDFGDFGAGLVEGASPDEAPPPRRSATPARPRVKAQPPTESPPVKPLPIEPAPVFNLSDLDEGPTDEELDEADDEDESEEDEDVPTAEGDDPYWDPLANWNWQEDDQSRKSPPDSGHDRGRSRTGRGERPERGPRGRGGRSDRRPTAPTEPVSGTEDHGLSSPRRPSQERDRGRVDETPVAESAATSLPVAPDVAASEDVEEIRPAGKSRRQDRRRSRRHTHPTVNEPEEPVVESSAEPSLEEPWPPVDDEGEESTAIEQPFARTPRSDDLEEDFEDEGAGSEEEPVEGTEADDRGPRRRRGRRRRRRNERPAARQQESAADEDIKHLEGEVEDDEFGDLSSSEESVAEPEESESDRPERPRRPRRRRRGGRPDRPERPTAPAPRARQEFDEEDDELEEEEVLASDTDDEFDEDQDREFVDEDMAPRSRRPPRSRRSASDTPFVRHIEDDDDDSEPEPAVSYEDVPSWEEAISYLLNPSMVEGNGGGNSGGDRGDRPPRGERPSRPPRRGPRRDS